MYINDHQKEDVFSKVLMTLQMQYSKDIEQFKGISNFVKNAFLIKITDDNKSLLELKKKK